MDRQSIVWSTAWSVTRVLAIRYGSAFWVPSQALERGSRVHEWTQSYDEGGIVVPPDDIAGWCDAYKAFSYAMSPSWTHVEHAVETDCYHGFIDRVGHMKGREVVADIKTGKPSKKDALQLAAYTQAMFPKTYRQVARVGIYISKSGDYKTVSYGDERDFILWNEILLEALNDGTGTTAKAPKRGSRADLGCLDVGDENPHSDTGQLREGVRCAEDATGDAKNHHQTLQED